MNKRLTNCRSHRSLKGKRRGTILVITAIVLLALVGLLGLVIDAGLLMTAHRQAQNAADAGATAAAMDMLTGQSDATAIATAAAFVQEHNALADATVTTNIPPASGVHQGEENFAEVIVDFPVRTHFIQVLGVASLRSVSARSVAGWESARVAAGVMALDPNARPGINLTGNGDLKVNGTVIVNSDGGGLDEFGQPIGNGNSGSAITTAGNGVLYAHDVESVGGVSTPSMIKNYDAGSSESPLHTGSLAQPDPFQYLPPPTTANGAVATDYGEVKLSGSVNVTLSPGVYSSISVSSNVNVTLSPGIYIIAGGGITMTGNSTLNGSNVMVYNTGSDYNVNTGLPDSGDGSTAAASGSATFGSVSITGNAALNLTPYSNASSPFDGMILYQRRLNPQPLKLAGNGTSDVLSGTVYAKSAPLDLSGNGTFNAQFVVKSVELTGNGTLTLDFTNQNSAKSNLVYLVE